MPQRSPLSRLLLTIGLWSAAAANVGACQDSEPQRFSDTIRVFVWPEQPLPSEETFDIVGETFGMEVVTSNDWLGSITLYVSDYVEDAGRTGFATSRTCSPHLVMSPRITQLVLTHEIGHTLGLQHVDTPGNLMNVDDMDFNVDDEQIRTARSSAGAMETCKN